MSRLLVSLEKFKNSLSDGLSRLQQKEEFVDMTLAADGHFVKVHQNVIALASPYLKTLLKSAQCQHPIIFLSGVSCDILSYILEYIYTGEVQVPNETLPEFINISKSLHISGISGLMGMCNNATNYARQPANNINDIDEYPCVNRSSEEEPIPVSVSKYQNDSIPVSTAINQESQIPDHNTIIPDYVMENDTVLPISNPTETDEIDENVDCNENPLYTISLDQTQVSNSLQTPITMFTDARAQQGVATDSSSTDKISDVAEVEKILFKESDMLTRYSKSNRGSLQLVLNRFVYYCHHQSSFGRKRRWRCIYYRKLACPAFIDSFGDVFIKRKFEHVHPHHDKEILKKIKRNEIFDSVDEALTHSK